MNRNAQQDSRDVTVEVIPALGKGRLWLMRLCAATIVPLVVLGSLEVLLRITGYGYSTSFFLPRKIQGVDYLVPNREFTRQFFPEAIARTPLPSRMLADKPDGTYRIFLFGGSAAYGDPDPSFGMGRYLEALLENRYPGIEFEVVNVAVTAINSHVVLPIARDCAKRDGDLWIIYMGNNEMVGPYGAGTVFGTKSPSVGFVRAALALRRTRIGQLLEDLVKAGSSNNGDMQEWQGIDMFSQNLLSYDDENRLRAYRNFRRNLEDIIREGKGAGVPVVVSTVASNLKDCSPFASLRSGGNNQSEVWEELFESGKRLEEEGSYRDALETYLAAAQLDPGFAELQFRIGSCQLALGDSESALNALTKARDRDALVVRADSTINEIIATVTGSVDSNTVRLVDAVQAFANSNDIPGQESFYEHVHFTMEGNFKLARAIADEVDGLLPESITSNGVYGTSLSEQMACERRLAVTIWDQKRLWNVALGRISVKPFTSQSSHERNIQYCEDRKLEVDSRTNPQTPARDLNLYQTALEQEPEDNFVRWNYAQFLERNGSVDDAIEQGAIICQQLPDSPWPHFFTGSLLAREGRVAEAVLYLERAIQIQPHFPMAEKELKRISTAR